MVVWSAASNYSMARRRQIYCSFSGYEWRCDIRGSPPILQGYRFSGSYIIAPWLLTHSNSSAQLPCHWQHLHFPSLASQHFWRILSLGAVQAITGPCGWTFKPTWSKWSKTIQWFGQHVANLSAKTHGSLPNTIKTLLTPWYQCMQSKKLLN